MRKIALVSGASGQDASYLFELLLQKDYEVHGIVRHVALENPGFHLSRIEHILDKIKLHSATLESYASLHKVIQEVKPDECYHLAAQSFVKYSFEDEFSTLNTNVNGTHYMLAAIKEIVPKCKFYFAASSEMMGKVEETPQTEKTRFHPRSAYGISKCAGYYLTQYYREAYNLFACNGILYNHESPRRGLEFVTRKISDAVAKISLGSKEKLILGNINAQRDWGHSRDYVEAMYLMLQQDKSDDYIVATNETHSVKEFIEEAFKVIDIANWQDYVQIDEAFKRPADVELLQGDYSKAKRILNWQPKITFKELVRLMVESDIKLLEKSIKT
jgi:GDPmannose 4,6-dehydratase